MLSGARINLAFIRSLLWPDMPAVRFFLIIGWLIGILFCIFIPYGAGFDEEHHATRIYEIAGYHWLPNHIDLEEPRITPKSLISLSYQRRYIREPAFDMFEIEKFTQKITDYYYNFETRSTYPPVLFFLQAFVARRFWLAWDLPILPTIIVLRLVGLGLYLTIGATAIRILKKGKWVLTITALVPMALFQAATLNMDGVTNALSFLFLAIIMNLAGTPQNDNISSRSIGYLIAIIIFLGVAKPGAIFLFVFLIALPFQKIRHKNMLVLLAFSVGLAVIFNLGWNTIAETLNGGQGGQNLGSQRNAILVDPSKFLLVYLRDSLNGLPTLYRNWVGSYGHWAGSVPRIIYLAYPLALIASVFAESDVQPLSKKQRVLMGMGFLLALAATLLVYYAVNYIPGTIVSLRQGRYLIPIMPLLAIPFAGVRIFKTTIMKNIAVITLSIALFFYSFGLYATYYSYCAQSIYTRQTCIQPAYQNLNLKNSPSILIHSQNSLTQTFSPACGRLEGVEIYITENAYSPDAALEISLLDSNGQKLARSIFHSDQVIKEQYLVMQFDSIISETNADHSIQLTSNAASPDGFKVMVSSGNASEGYARGALFGGEDLIESDLIFHYICARLW